jgi:hypothetical protein
MGGRVPSTTLEWGGRGGSDPPMLLHAWGLGVLNIPYAVARTGRGVRYTVCGKMWMDVHYFTLTAVAFGGIVSYPMLCNVRV